MFKKATSSILEGIKNKMQKIDDSSANVDNSDDQFLGLDDGFENLNTSKNLQNNDVAPTQKMEEDAPVKRNFNTEIEEIEKVMNSDSDQHQSDEDEIEEIEQDEDVEENSDEEEIEDLEEFDESAESEKEEDLEELEELEEEEDLEEPEELEEEIDETQSDEEIEEHDFSEPEELDDKNDEEKHEEINEEIDDIEGDFHDFDLDVEDDVVQKVSESKLNKEQPIEDLPEEFSDDLGEEFKKEPEINAENKDDDFADLDKEDHEEESDFEMKDVEVKEEKIAKTPEIKKEKKAEESKSVSDNFFGEFNEKEEIEIAVEDEPDDADEITFNIDETQQKPGVKSSEFFGDEDSHVNSLKTEKEDVKKKNQPNEKSEEEIGKILANTGIEESLSVENIEDVSDHEIELSFDDLVTKPNFNNFNKMSSAKLNSEELGISSKLLSEQTIKKSSDFIKNIMNNIGKVDGSGSAKFNHGVTVEEMVAIMLQPKLEEWLNNHLPEIVEKVVREEVKKILPNN